MKKKFVSIVVAFLLVVTSFAALTGCGKNKEKTISVLLLANSNEMIFYNSYFKKMESQLKDEGLDYKIEFRSEQETAYYQALDAAIQRGDAPDIFYVRPNEILQYKTVIAPLQEYADSQTEVDLSDIYETALNMYRYNPETGELGNPNDGLYAFPKDLSTQQLGYNRKLLSEYQTAIKGGGYPMPWELNGKTYTWDEYRAICKIILSESKKSSKDIFVTDVPDIEILTKSFAGQDELDSIIDLSGGRTNGKIASLTTGPVKKAIEYQANLVTDGVAVAGEGGASYANFTGGKVCFYGLVGSWEVGEYNDYLNSDGGDNWGVMPWPTVDGSMNWNGLIKSAGYVVSQKCASMAKGDVAKKIALSFMSNSTQEQMVKDAKISLPLRKSVREDYLSKENNDTYSPSTRNVFMDVISGEHGFFPAEYSTYNTAWLTFLDTQLGVMYDKLSGAKAYFDSYDWAGLQATMQQAYNNDKDK